MRKKEEKIREKKAPKEPIGKSEQKRRNSPRITAMSNNYSLRRHTRTLKLQNLPNEILIIVEVSVVLIISTASEKGNERGRVILAF